MFPREINQLLKRYPGSVRKKTRQAQKIWQRGKPSQHLKLHLQACHPTGSRCSPSHRTRAGRGPASPTTRSHKKESFVKSSPCMSSHPQMPFFFLFFRSVKNHQGIQGEGFLQPAGALLLLSCAVGQRSALKKNPQSPKPAPSGITQKLLFVTVLCVTAWHYFPNPAFSSLPFFFSLGTRCTEGTRISTRQHFSYKQYRINNHRAAVPVGRDSTKCWHIYLCS